MKPIKKQWKPTEPPDTPYARAEQEWDKRMGNAVIQAKNWRLATFCVILLVGLPAVIGMIFLGSQPKMVPHIVEVNAVTGEANYLGPVGRSWENFTPKSSSIKHHLRRFLDNTRTVSSDAEIMRRNWFDAYKLVTPNAANTLSKYAQENDPFTRARTERVYIKEIIAQQPISKDTWQVDWSEEIKNKRGQLVDTLYWRGVFTILLTQPTNQKELVDNPIGLFIDDYNWSQISRN